MSFLPLRNAAGSFRYHIVSQSLHRTAPKWHLPPQSTQVWLLVSISLLRHSLEQYFGVLSLNFLTKNSLPQYLQAKVQHSIQRLMRGDRFLIGLPHFSQLRGGQVGYGNLRLSNWSGCSFQYLLSAFAWQDLQRVMRLCLQLPSLMCLKTRKGITWWQSKVLRVPLMPQCWQRYLSRLITSSEILCQFFPRYIAMLQL